MNLWKQLRASWLGIALGTIGFAAVLFGRAILGFFTEVLPGLLGG